MAQTIRQLQVVQRARLVWVDYEALPAFPEQGIDEGDVGQTRREFPEFGYVGAVRDFNESVLELTIEPGGFRYDGRPHSFVSSRAYLVIEVWDGFRFIPLTQVTPYGGWEDE